MSEMIGNYFFLNHSYERAIPLLEAVLSEHPEHLRARKKLVIAYTECGRLRDAYRLFAQLIDEDPTVITCTDPEAEDCPCPKLVDAILDGERSFDDPANRTLVLGMYSAYCSVNESVFHFRDYLRLFPRDDRAKRILEQLSSQLSNSNVAH